MDPVFGTPRNVSIPTTSFTNGKGSLTFQLFFPSNQKFVITMSDATGYATGGTTNIQTVGASQGGVCNTTDPGIDYSFELNTALQQCRPYVISGYTGAVQPVTVIATIPGGQSILIGLPTGSTSFNWNANIAAGTSVLFTMVDAMGRNGGTSDIKTVGITDDATCLNNLSPSSTATSATSTAATSTTSHSASGTATDSPTATAGSGQKTSIAAIAGTVIGALVFLAVVITLGLFFLRKRRDNNNVRRPRNTDLDLTYDPTHAHGNYPYSSGAGIAGASSSPLAMNIGGGAQDYNPFSDSPQPQTPYQQAAYGASTYTPSQYQAPSQYGAPSQYQYSEYQSQYQQPSQYQPSQRQESEYSMPPSHSQQRSYGSEPGSFNPYTLTSDAPSVIQPFDTSDSVSTTLTSAQRKAAMSGVSGYTPSRFIVHTDVEDELPPPNQDGVVELPPQYSERHGAATTAAATAGPSSHNESPLRS
ncbi:hypothetical protein DXG01_000268 [Tephrocybe rancida]|nr:hypothetical protein DXG01_000268 [Tephrocybe rancida]